MKENVHAEILDWSKGRPTWQRDALKRIFTKGVLDSADLADLTDICKSARGLSSARTVEALAATDLKLGESESDPTTLLKVTHNHGVNALAREQSVTFGPMLTVVYGQNAAGKSGYTRILKKACRSRSSEAILGNVLSTETPLRGQATIHFSLGLIADRLEWHPEEPSAPALAAVSVFDSHSAAVYLKDKTDVAFRPFGLDVFDKLSKACGDVRAQLDAERTKLSVANVFHPPIPEGTRAKAAIDGISSLTNLTKVRELATLTPIEDNRLKDLKTKDRDAKVADPAKLARELTLKASRLEAVRKHVENVARTLGDSTLAELRQSAEALDTAQKALDLLLKTALTPDLLRGTGETAWRRMWDSVRGFSGIAYPGAVFPRVDDGAVCPFCQQSIARDAAARLTHFAEYISSSAQTDVARADAALQAKLAALLNVNVSGPEIELIRGEIEGDDAALASELKDFLGAALVIQNEIRTGTNPRPEKGPTGSPEGKLLSATESLRARALAAQSSASGLTPAELLEISDMESRLLLQAHLATIENEIERHKRLAVYAQCIDDTSTQAITRKSTELTKELITDRLRKTFAEELSLLEFTHLSVEVQAAGGARGEMFHRLVFANAPAVAVHNVLSEGESRTLSLAAFLTELSTASSKSAIIFDDPVSSLDHIWRERIASRLIEEAKKRQVIVFTHDLLFLRLLTDSCEKQSIECRNQYVRRNDTDGAGICSDDLPWVAMGVKKRIGVLRNNWQTVEKLFRTTDIDVYEKEGRSIYGMLREAWEQAVAEVLLNDVVARLRPSIETQRIANLHDITATDCATVANEMTECSRWIRGHDQAAADGTPFPKPTNIKERIDALENWTKAISKRRP